MCNKYVFEYVGYHTIQMVFYFTEKLNTVILNEKN